MSRFNRTPVARMATTLVLAGGLLAAAPVFAASYYVDQAHAKAADTNPGTEALPWKTMYRAMKQSLQPGDTVFVKKGTYDARTGGTWSLPVFNPATSGTADKPITFQAVPLRSVILDNGGANGKPPIGSRMRHYIVWDGFVLPNPGDKAVAVFGESESNRVKGVVIKNSVIHGVWKNIADNTDGIRLEHAADAVVRNNRIYDVANAAGTENAAAVKLYSTRNVLIENNEFYDVTTGIYDKINNQYNVYRNNFIHDCGKSGFYFRSPSDASSTSPDSRGTKVYQNVVSNCNKAVELLPSAGRGVYDTEVYNNTFTNYRDGGILPPRYNGTVKIYNNVFYRAKAPARGDIFTYDDPVKSVGLSDFNVFVSEPTFKVGVYLTNRVLGNLSAWRTYTGKDKNSRVGDAVFRNVSSLDFHLGTGSAAKGAGRVGGVASGAVVDAGAFPNSSVVVGLRSEAGAPAAPRNITIIPH